MVSGGDRRARLAGEDRRELDEWWESTLTEHAPSEAEIDDAWRRNREEAERFYTRGHSASMQTQQQVYLVLNGKGGVFSSLFDEPLAHEAAKAIEGVVASLPITADYRKKAAE